MAKLDGFKVTLQTGKVVLMRKMRIGDHPKAAESASMLYHTEQGQKAGLAQEILKMLLYSINDKVLSGPEKEDLDALFDMNEYADLMKVVTEAAGLDEKKAKAPTVEIVSIGDK